MFVGVIDTIIAPVVLTVVGLKVTAHEANVPAVRVIAELVEFAL